MQMWSCDGDKHQGWNTQLCVCTLQFFDGMEHGWTVRGDTSDPKVGPAVVEAYDRALHWFQKHL